MTERRERKRPLVWLGTFSVLPSGHCSIYLRTAQTKRRNLDLVPEVASGGSKARFQFLRHFPQDMAHDHSSEMISGVAGSWATSWLLEDLLQGMARTQPYCHFQ